MFCTSSNKFTCNLIKTIQSEVLFRSCLNMNRTTPIYGGFKPRNTGFTISRLLDNWSNASMYYRLAVCWANQRQQRRTREVEVFLLHKERYRQEWLGNSKWVLQGDNWTRRVVRDAIVAPPPLTWSQCSKAQQFMCSNRRVLLSRRQLYAVQLGSVTWSVCGLCVSCWWLNSPSV